LEKFLGVGSFGGFIDHLVCHQAILFASLGGLGFLFVVRITTFAFLGRWALITFAFVIHFG